MVTLPGVKFGQFINGGSPQAGDMAAGLRAGNNTLFDLSGFNGAALARQIIQAAHGFTVNTVLRFDSGTLMYVRAQADNAADAEVLGIVAAVIDLNTFVLQFGGYLTGLTPLTIATMYFLSDVTAGLLTSTPPVTVGTIRKPLLFTDSTTSAYWLNYQGQQL